MKYITMNKQNIIIALVITIGIVLMGCQLTPVPYTELEIQLLSPGNFEDIELDKIELVVYNTSTGRTMSKLSDPAGKITITVEEGIYNLSLQTDKEIIIPAENNRGMIKQKITIRAMKEKFLVTGTHSATNMQLLVNNNNPGFVIKEIYFAGSTTPARGSYFQDQFIEIFNNSDSILYADGLSVLEGSHLSSHANPQFTEYPNDFVVGAIYTVPGNGKDYPVLPGRSLVIASMGINHRLINSNSPVDMSTADFEWFDGGNDVDVPEVPNMIRNFCYSNTIWVMHVRGFRAYAIFKSPIDYNSFLKEQSIQVLTPSGNSVTRVKVPNHLIIDGVELGAPGNIGSKALLPNIDLGYTYCLATYNGRSVRRKVSHFNNERVYLLDTNNSSRDFIPNAIPKPREFTD